MYVSMHDMKDLPPYTVVAYSLNVTAIVSPESPLEHVEGTVSPAAPQLADLNPLRASNAVMAAA